MYHTCWVTSIQKLDNSRVLTTSADRTLKIWDMDTLKCVNTLRGHSDWVLCATKVADGLIVSGSLDKTLKMWDLETMACTACMIGHTDAVTCVVQLSNGMIVSGSDDQTLQIWEIEDKGTRSSATFQCKELGRHSGWVTCLVQLSNGYVVSGGSDAVIKVWSVMAEATDCMFTVRAHDGAVRCLTQLEDGRVVTGSSDDTLKVWSFENYSDHPCTDPAAAGDASSTSRMSPVRMSCIGTAEGHQNWVVSVVQMADGRVLSGSWDGTMKIWDLVKQCGQAIDTADEYSTALICTKNLSLNQQDQQQESSVDIRNSSSVKAAKSTRVLGVAELSDGRVLSASVG
jgi:WD40 repeat protein